MRYSTSVFTSLLIVAIAILLCSTHTTFAAAALVTNNGSTTTVLWEINTTDGDVVMNPIIVEGSQWFGFGEQVAITIVPTNTSVYVIRLDTGEVVWRTILTTVERGGGACAASSVGYVSACGGGNDGRRQPPLVFVGCVDVVVALHAGNGSVAWTTDIPPSTTPPYHPQRHVRADCVQGSDWLMVASFNAPLLILNATLGGGGAVLHDFNAQFPGTFAKDHIHVTKNHVVFLNTWPAPSPSNDFSAVIVLDRETLTTSYMLGNAVNLLVDEATNRLFVRYYVNTTQTVVVYDLPSGRELWSASEPGLFATFDYFYDNGRLFMATSLINDAYPNNLTAYNATTGDVLWRQVIGFYYLLAGDEAVFALGTVTHAKAYHAATGQLLWENDAVAVNDGAVGSNAVVFGTSTSIIALQILQLR